MYLEGSILACFIQVFSHWKQFTNIEVVTVKTATELLPNYSCDPKCTHKCGQISLQQTMCSLALFLHCSYLAKYKLALLR